MPALPRGEEARTEKRSVDEAQLGKRPARPRPLSPSRQRVGLSLDSLQPFACGVNPLDGTNYLDTASAFLKAFLHLLAGEGVWGRGRHLSPFPQ